MVGIATGLAERLVPFVYSIATFTSMRCYEQVRNGPVLHQLPVRVVGVGGGFAYGHAGPTHYALEDLAIARTQPGIPRPSADPAQTRAIVRATVELPGPAYLRRRAREATPRSRARRALRARPARGRPRGEGRCASSAAAAVVHEALGAPHGSKPQGVSAAVAVLAHLSVRGEPDARRVSRAVLLVVTVEEGLRRRRPGLARRRNDRAAWARLPPGDSGRGEPLSGVCGGEAYMRARSGLDAEAIARAATVLLA